MSRQLDPRLFGEMSTNENKASDELLPQLDRLPQDPTQLRAQMKKKENIEMKVDAFMSKVSEAQRLMTMEVTKLEKRLERIEAHYKNAHESMMLKMQTTDRKLTERTVMENKVQALMERQNTMIQNFERKLNLLKKSIEEKEINNLKLSASLREAQNKIARMSK
ncbi:MAG: hypothetical protein VX642_12370 [Bdellovibrionota bacterium]|nr:hypothetical protein [Bdellovibrionota bacterium]